MENLINIVPEQYRWLILSIIVIAPMIGKAYRALANGVGLRGVWNALIYGIHPPVISPTVNQTDNTNMKKIVSILAIASLSLCAMAQTNSPQNFYQSVQSYFTSFDTNSQTFLSDKVDISLGTVTIENSQLAADFLAEFQVKNPLSLEIDVRNTTVAGTVLSYAGGLGYNITHFDTRITGFIDGGYKTDTKSAYFAPGIRIKKALTANTYAGIGIELPIYLHNSGHSISPTYVVSAGFKF